mmetsp:Transcript_23117/g.50064  ORF Transcript_23117/g.50064 Transcript_23117/m.50064 type:complete len:358 (+) Transcript_23117:332-1405(+)
MPGMAFANRGALLRLVSIAPTPSIRREQIGPRTARHVIINVVKQANVGIKHHLGSVTLGVTRGPILKIWVFRRFPCGPRTAYQFLVVPLVENFGVSEARDPGSVMTRELTVCKSKGMGTQQCHGILPLHSHPFQEHTFNLPTTLCRRQPICRPRTRGPLGPTPIKRPFQIQSLINRRQMNNCIRNKDPPVPTRNMRILLDMQLVHRGMLVPNGTQPRVIGRVPIETAVQPIGMCFIVLIIVHKVVCDEANAAADEVCRILFVVDRFDNGCNIVLDFVVHCVVDTAGHVDVDTRGTAVENARVAIVLARFNIAVIPLKIGTVGEAPSALGGLSRVAAHGAILQSITGKVICLSPLATV